MASEALTAPGNQPGPVPILAALAAIALGAWGLRTPAPPPALPDEALLGRVWVDQIIEGTIPDYPVHLYRFDQAQPVGAYRTWEHDGTSRTEALRYSLEGGTIRIEFPESGEAAEGPFRVERFDQAHYHHLRLVLDRDPKSPAGIYYSSDPYPDR